MCFLEGCRGVFKGVGRIMGMSAIYGISFFEKKIFFA